MVLWNDSICGWANYCNGLSELRCQCGLMGTNYPTTVVLQSLPSGSRSSGGGWTRRHPSCGCSLCCWPAGAAGARPAASETSGWRPVEGWPAWWPGARYPQTSGAGVDGTYFFASPWMSLLFLLPGIIKISVKIILHGVVCVYVCVWLHLKKNLLILLLPYLRTITKWRKKCKGE